MSLTPVQTTRHPVLAIIAGTGAGMFVNFGASRRFVFR